MRQEREEIELLVERIGARGDGIAMRQGEPVYLPFTLPGELVRARLGVSRGSGREGRVVERLNSAPGRSAPQCCHFGRCGGCALQHLDTELYRSTKRAILQQALVRVGIDPALVEPLRLASPLRRRARLGIVRPAAPHRPASVGFRERYRHDLIDLQQCAVLEPALFGFVEQLRGAACTLIEPGATADALLTRTDSGLDLVIEAAERPSIAALEALAGLAAANELARVVWRAKSGELPVVERRPVRVSFAGVSVALPPGAFLQASEEAERILVEAVVSGVGARRPVLDLFAGLGTFAFALAPSGAVHAVEGERETAAALTRAAPQAAGVSVERRDLERDPLTPEDLAQYAAAVFDPPRAGAPRQTAALAAAPLDTVVAVSCNPATFARDAALLRGGGFRIERIQTIDQFVWSPHLEIVAVFRR